MIDLVIPIQRPTAQLEKTLSLLSKYKNNVPTSLHIVERPDWNVSEARQQAMKDFGPLICFLDDDSEMVMDHWLDEMLAVLESSSRIGAVFGGEQWGTEEPPTILNYERSLVMPFPMECPAACMLIDTQRIDNRCYWDTHIGLRSGWLGGDFEEIDFANKLLLSGLELHRATGMYFRHTGGKTTREAFIREDRCKCIQTMIRLIGFKYSMDPFNDDWFKHLKYVKADDNNDCKLAPGYTMRECYIDVINNNRLNWLFPNF